MRRFVKIISTITLLAIIIVSALAFVCPMNMVEAKAVQHNCHEAESGPVVGNVANNCMDHQLAFAEQTLNNLTNATLLFSLIVLSAALALFFSNFFFVDLHYDPAKARRLFTRYREEIRLMTYRNFLRYLVLLGSCTLVSNQ